MNCLLLIVCLSLIISTFAKSASDDEITKLPGFDQPFPSKQYSGYLQGSNTSYLHYWLVESEANPLTDPVVVW